MEAENVSQSPRDIHKERLSLHEDIEAWRTEQALLMPGVAQLFDGEGGLGSRPVEQSLGVPAAENEVRDWVAERPRRGKPNFM